MNRVAGSTPGHDRRADTETDQYDEEQDTHG
jgi:hypothetical protein